jgi:hypothetical protein
MEDVASYCQIDYNHKASHKKMSPGEFKRGLLAHFGLERAYNNFKNK